MGKKNSIKPSFKEEKILWKKGIKYVVGVDEVGRGAFAGPLVAAAVIFPPFFSKQLEINDSKLLLEKKRIKIAKEIKKNALSIGIGSTSVNFINKHGIIKANQKAFYNAVKNLNNKPDYILIDAFYIKKLDKLIQKPIIHGDSISTTIAAASIIAKVYRDNIMINLHKKYPMYNFLNNKGYGTKYHRDMIKKYDTCKHHRTCFNLGA